jgi:hypothetical protein
MSVIQTRFFESDSVKRMSSELATSYLPVDAQAFVVAGGKSHSCQALCNSQI